MEGVVDAGCGARNHRGLFAFPGADHIHQILPPRILRRHRHVESMS